MLSVPAEQAGVTQPRFSTQLNPFGHVPLNKQLVLEHCPMPERVAVHVLPLGQVTP